jgi:multicomponent Na+:H+ antiporter subunit B
VIWQIDVVMLPILVIAAITALTVRDLAAAAIVFGAFSFLACILYAAMAAVDVAFTEAMIGAGVSGVVMFAALFRTSRRTSPREPERRVKWSALAALVFAGALMMFSEPDLPAFGSRDSAPSVHVSPRYLEKAYEETHAENQVTAVIADYRGFDTMLESAVILIAGLATALVLWPAHRARAP